MARLKSGKKYPSPGPVGGALIREVVRAFRSDLGFDVLPVNSDILIGVSGGSDSLALAQLLLRYGRRLIAPENILLLHLNHGWRGRESDEDERFVERFAREHGARFRSIRLAPPTEKLPRESWEEYARDLRHREFRKEARGGGWVLTAHHADDVAETLIWRFFTGVLGKEGQGIRWKKEDTRELRPLLRVGKETLQAFLKEEKQDWREDETNHQARFLRSKMRQQLLPLIREIFPAYRECIFREATGLPKSQRILSLKG